MKTLLKITPEQRLAIYKEGLRRVRRGECKGRRDGLCWALKDFVRDLFNTSGIWLDDHVPVPELWKRRICQLDIEEQEDSRGYWFNNGEEREKALLGAIKELKQKYNL